MNGFSFKTDKNRTSDSVIMRNTGQRKGGREGGRKRGGGGKGRKRGGRSQEEGMRRV